MSDETNGENRGMSTPDRLDSEAILIDLYASEINV
jgi:hypothetical protein